MRRFAIVMALAGCGGGGSGGGPDDAAPPPIDESPPIDEPPMVARSVVFLQFEGATLNMGATDEATTDTSSSLSGPATLTAHRVTDPNRLTRIAGVVTAFETIVSPFAIEVVTTRPAAGPYDMIVVGGSPGQAGLPDTFGGTVALDCANAIANKIILVFSDVFINLGDDQLASVLVAGLGVSQGISSSNLANDCLCWAGTACTATTLCTFHPNAPIVMDDQCANGATTMNTFDEFASVFPLLLPP